jgi:8-oxo-dGTP diphosphatase
MIRRQRTRVAAYALCHDVERRVLLCRVVERIAPGGLWTLPGGGLEFGESPADAVLRELAEETGLRGEIIELLDVGDRLFEGRRRVRMHAIQIVYRVRIVGGELRDEIGGSTETCAWFTVADALGLRLGHLAREVLATDEARSTGQAAT